MTPKEKAEKLVDRFEHETYSLVQGQLSKQCALIAVDEILKLETINAVNFNGIYQTSLWYWQEVKNEIEKL